MLKEERVRLPDVWLQSWLGIWQEVWLLLGAGLGETIVSTRLRRCIFDKCKSALERLNLARVLHMSM